MRVVLKSRHNSVRKEIAIVQERKPERIYQIFLSKLRILSNLIVKQGFSKKIYIKQQILQC